MADDDDLEGFQGAYEHGQWVWDDVSHALVFLRNVSADSLESIVNVTAIMNTGAMAFKDDVDLLQQLRFQKHFARKIKPGQPDIITLQDIKDLAIFTAPVSLLSSMLINLLHLPTTERFIRALILYCQYYLQVEDKMSKRIEELERMVRTPDSDVVEGVLRQNLCDLRALVTKEYSIILVGAADTKKFHHKGSQKKLKSLGSKDARLFETLIRMAIQIVWLALTRRCFDKIELEVNRILKTDYFNSVEHTRKSGFVSKMRKESAKILLGDSLRHDAKLNSCSPLMNEVSCARNIDYRMMGLGIMKFDKLDDRLKYMLSAVAGPESDLLLESVTVGILGLPRSYFDTMLHVLPTALDVDVKRSSIASSGSRASGRSKASGAKSSGNSTVKDKPLERFIYGEVILPARSDTEPTFPELFPKESFSTLPCNDRQRRKWQARLYKLLHQHLDKGRRRSAYMSQTIH